MAREYKIKKDKELRGYKNGYKSGHKNNRAKKRLFFG